MLTSGLVSIASISANICIFVVLVLISDSDTSVHDTIEAGSALLISFLLIYVPLILASLLFQHLTGIFKYIMYSNKMVVLESSVFVMGDFMVIWLLKVPYLKSVLFLSLIIVMCVAWFIKKICQQRFLNFQIEMENSYVKPSFDEKFDIMLSIISSMVLLIPSLLFVFIFFP